MDELTLDGEVFLSTKRAAKITGYAKDYIGQLCREGRVAARLVGRNWYVLESSIKAHRFGEETVELTAPAQMPEPMAASEPESDTKDIQAEIKALAEDSWVPSLYTPETAPEPLPIAPSVPTVAATLSQAEIEAAKAQTEATSIEQKPGINLVNGRFPAREQVPLSSKIVNDMQEAWQDWFIRTNEFKVSKETLLEESYEPTQTSISAFHSPVASSEPTISIHREETMPLKEENNEEEGVTPIKLEKIIEPELASSMQIDQESEDVPIRRTITAPMPIRSQHYASNAQISRYAEAKEGRILRERQILNKKRPNHAIQIIFLVLALIALFVTAIGSGQTEQFIGNTFTSFKPVQFLLGESTLNK